MAHVLLIPLTALQCRQAEFPHTESENSSAKRFALFYMVAGLPGPNVIRASGCTSSILIHFSVPLHLLLLLKTSPLLKQRPVISPQLDDCTLQLSHNGTYLDMESSLAEQRDELEGFQQDDTGWGTEQTLLIKEFLKIQKFAISLKWLDRKASQSLLISLICSDILVRVQQN